MASSQFRTVTIAGATGNIGYPIAEALLADGNYKVKIFRKEPKTQNEKADLLASKGAEIVYVDYSQQDKLAKELKGTDVIISAVSSFDPSFDHQTVQSPLLAAAKEAGVKRFIPSEFGSGMRKDAHPFTDGKARFREELEKSGLEYTYIYNGLFHEYVGMMGFDVKNKTAKFYADGNSKIALTCLSDVAKYTVESLKIPAARNSALRVSGETLSLNEILQKFEKATGSKWKVIEDKNVRERFRTKTAPVPTILEDFLALIQHEGSFDKTDNDKFSFTPKPVDETITMLVKQA